MNKYDEDINTVERMMFALASVRVDGKPIFSTLQRCKETLQQAKEREENPPLTLEQLKERVGKPVYLINNDDYGYWCIVAYDGGLYSWSGFIIEYDDIKSKIKAIYDHEPKGEVLM